MIYCKVCVLLTENVRNRTLITVLKSVWFDFLFQRDILMQLLQLRWDALRIQYIHDTTGHRRVGWSDLFLFGNIWNRTYCCRSVIETYQAQEIGSSNVRFEVWSLVARAWQNFFFFYQNGKNCVFDLFKGKKLVSLQFSLLKKWKQTFPFDDDGLVHWRFICQECCTVSILPI